MALQSGPINLSKVFWRVGAFRECFANALLGAFLLTFLGDGFQADFWPLNGLQTAHFNQIVIDLYFIYIRLSSCEQLGGLVPESPAKVKGL